jgi:hypothetical protein
LVLPIATATLLTSARQPFERTLLARHYNSAVPRPVEISPVSESIPSISDSCANRTNGRVVIRD